MQCRGGRTGGLPSPLLPSSALLCFNNLARIFGTFFAIVLFAFNDSNLMKNIKKGNHVWGNWTSDLCFYSSLRFLWATYAALFEQVETKEFYDKLKLHLCATNHQSFNRVYLATYRVSHLYCFLFEVDFKKSETRYQQKNNVFVKVETLIYSTS